MTTHLWQHIWLWTVIAALGSIGLVEASSIIVRALWYPTEPLMEWTLSDFIRRWSKVHHWLPYLIVASFAILSIHWFASNGV